MSEEEKKAIKRIYDVTHNSDGSHVYYIDIDDVVNTEEDLESCETFCKAIDTVLNLVDKQNKELNKLKSKNEELLRKLRNRVKENNKLIKYSNYKKVIDEMIQEYEYNARINVKDFCEECQRKDKCIQDCHTHIKQYFIRKVNGDDNRTS